MKVKSTPPFTNSRSLLKCRLWGYSRAQSSVGYRARCLWLNESPPAEGGLNSQNTGSAANLLGMVSSGRREPQEKTVTPGKSDQDTRPLGSKDLLSFPRTGKGRESRRAKVQGHNQVQSLENLTALLPQGLAGEEQARATLCKISVYSTPFMNSRNSVERGHVCVSSKSRAKDEQEET